MKWKWKHKNHNEQVDIERTMNADMFEYIYEKWRDTESPAISDRDALEAMYAYLTDGSLDTAMRKLHNIDRRKAREEATTLREIYCEGMETEEELEMSFNDSEDYENFAAKMIKYFGENWFEDYLTEQAEQD